MIEWHKEDRTMTIFRDTYKYQVKRGNKILHTGITNDIVRREHELKMEYGVDVYTKKVGNRTTIEEGLQWEAKQWEAKQRKKRKSTGP